jgi:hypothetical protein
MLNQGKQEDQMTRMDEKVLAVLQFYDSEEGHQFWMENRAKGMDWEDSIINLILKASYPETAEELEIVMWRIEDLLIARGAVRVAA